MTRPSFLLLRTGDIFAVTLGDGIFSYTFRRHTYSEPNIFATTIENSVVTIDINGTAFVGNQITAT